MNSSYLTHVLTSLYIVPFYVSLSGLVLWFFYRKDRRKAKRMSRLFLLGYIAYILTLAFAKSTLTENLFVLSRDMLVMGFTIVFLSRMRQSSSFMFVSLAIVITIHFLIVSLFDLSNSLFNNSYI